MKKEASITIAFVLLFLISSCAGEKAGEVTIKGQFAGNIPEVLRYTVPVNGNVFEGFFETIALDSLGGFEIHLELERPALISFRYYDSPSLIVEPGKHYEIILNLNKDRKLSIEGDLGIVQKFFNELPHENPLTCLYSFGDEISNYNEINKRLKSELAKEELAIHQLYSDGKITENLKNLLITERKFYYKAAQGVLAGTNRFAFLGNNEPIPDDLHQIWQEALDFEKIDNNYFLQSYFAWSLIEQKIWQNIYTKYDVEEFTLIRAEKRKANLTHSHNVELAKEFFSGDILEYYLAGLFYHQMMRREIDVNLQAIYEKFQTDYPESEYFPFVRDIYLEMIKDQIVFSVFLNKTPQPKKMKHIANLILPLIFFFACGQKKEYTIIGAFNGETQEEWVYLGKFLGGEFTGDSARIEEGRFIFKGTAGFPEVYGLSYNPATNPEVFPFFVEPGELIIEIDLNDWYSGSTITGGKANQEYQELHQFRMENFVNKIWELSAKRFDADESERELISKEISELWALDQEYQLDYIKKNPGSPVSIFLLAFFYPNMPVDDLAETLAIFTPEVQKTDIFKDISKHLNNQIDLQQFTPALSVGDRIEEINVEFNEAVILQTIAEQNPGKAVLVNIWGSWCNPCKKEFPYIRQIQKDFENRELAFVFLCVMSQKEDWLELVATENLKGQHFLLSNELSNRLFEETGSRAVPAYIIIDNSGALVNPNAPRPSDANLRAQLSELLD